MDRRSFIKLGVAASALLAVSKALALNAVKPLPPSTSYVHTTGTYFAFSNGLELIQIGRAQTMMKALAIQMYDLEAGEWTKDRMPSGPKRTDFGDLVPMTNADLVDIGVMHHHSYVVEPHAQMSMYLPRQNILFAPIDQTSTLWPHVNHELRSYLERTRACIVDRF